MISKILSFFISMPRAFLFLSSALPQKKTRSVFFCFLALACVTLLIVAFAFQKERFRRLAVVGRNIKRGRHAPTSAILYFPEAVKEDAKTDEESEALMPKSLVDSRKADELISDKMAKNLLKRASSVESFGKKRGIVNIGELSRKFKNGERIDINRLKAVGLIPYDVAYVKVLAGGILDKKLFIIANGFSKSAIKMIALMGGEAVKCGTLKVKVRKEMDG